MYTQSVPSVSLKNRENFFEVIIIILKILSCFCNAFNVLFFYRKKTEASKIRSTSNSGLNIEEDSFQYSKAFHDYETYRTLKRQIEVAVKKKQSLKPSILLAIQNANPTYWESYYVVGEYYYQKKFYTAALNAFQKASTKEITTIPYKHKIDLYIKKLKRKLNQ